MRALDGLNDHGISSKGMVPVHSPAGSLPAVGMVPSLDSRTGTEPTCWKPMLPCTSPKTTFCGGDVQLLVAARKESQSVERFMSSTASKSRPGVSAASQRMLKG